ncbi:hypothetical protein F4808DRAFT_426758 [Astrocystis sublimbata]|nr:hypothetical protein F4808DRAFT_447191 [Astrocystis sublimbata]KAI0186823.1 hypothetical protein F4808DRAFT_447193 [Astrocystis sublimbata]KAI0200822.1 hypothetical protein F4808DRAFT_426758 [Astrocystis sublimbata]
MQPPLICGFCGTGNNRRGWVVDGPIARIDSHWSMYYRAIYCIGSKNNDPCLSGLACYREHDEKNYLPPEAHQRYDSLHIDPQSLITIEGVTPPGSDMPDSEQSTYAWGFRFHDSCWRLVEQACIPHSIDIKLLWRILRSVPHASSLPFWGHNFGGLYLNNSQTISRLGGVSNLMIPSTHYDPFDVPELKTRLAQIRIDSDSAIPAIDNSPATVSLAKVSARSDPFFRLPPELREAVLTFVATVDVLSFRLSSHAVAAIPLSQNFFKSRFWPDRELGAFFDPFLLRPSERAGIDWRELYRFSKERLRHNLVGLGERNRLRIWKQTVRPLAQAMGTVAKLSVLKGGSDWLQSWEGAKKASWKSVESLRSLDPELFGDLSHQILEAEIHLPPLNIEAIHVSVVEFFGKKFISGLAFQTEDDEDIELGYTMVGSEEPLIVEAGLEGFHIAVDYCGFGAISPYTSQHMESEYLDWVGERDDLPIQTLRCNGGTIRRIRAVFDGFRMQALYIPESNADGEDL